MSKGCFLIRFQPSMISQAFETIKQIDQVKVAFLVFGQWDAVVFTETPDSVSMVQLVIKINSIEGVKSTESLLEIP